MGVKEAWREPAHNRRNDCALSLQNVTERLGSRPNGAAMQAIFPGWEFRFPGKNLFPSEYQGLPTWYEIPREWAGGTTAARADYDLEGSR